MIQFNVTDRRMAGYLGILPQFFSEDDPRPAKEQIHERYAHGGGWQPFNGFLLTEDIKGRYLQYTGDPPVREIAHGKLRDETIILFVDSWVAIVQKDGNYEVARVD